MKMVPWQRLAALLIAFLPGSLMAQGVGRVAGQIVDNSNGRPLAGAQIVVVGTNLEATTSIDGRFMISNIQAGEFDLRVVMIGYSPKLVTGLMMVAGDVTSQDITLSATTVELAELVVTASAESGSVDAALNEQRNSVAIVNSVSAEQISRSPDGDAADAVQRISGATVQDGRYIFVRGLGDRYTQASLNGARIPSPEPERKVVPLDLFPSSLLAGITTSKTFTPDQPGDFSGASVNIRTKEFIGQHFVKFSVSTGFNDAATGVSSSFAPAVSGDWLALGGNNRALPAGFNDTDFSSTLSSSATNSLINSFRNVWSPEIRSGAPNGSFGISTGGTLPNGGNGISYLVSGTYSNSTEIKRDQTRALAAAIGSGVAEERDKFVGSTGRNSVLWGGLANFSTTFGSNTSISLNNTYNRTMDDDGRSEIGTSENLGVPLRIDRLSYVERSIYSSQLGLRHELDNGRIGIDWGATLSGVSRNEPDRSEIVYSLDGGTPSWYGFSNEAAVRTFAKMNENSIEGNLNIQLALGDPWQGRFVRVGGLYRSTDRRANNDVYSLSLAQFLPNGADAAPPEDIFGGNYTGEGDDYFRIVPLGQGGSYTATDRLTAGYAMLVMPLGNSLDLVAGARIENSSVEVDSRSTDGTPSLANPVFTDVLPSVAVTWKAGENSDLRFSASQTLSRPQYRELSPIIFREVIGFDAIRGNPDLKRALVQNYDLRWEHYPTRGEILSIGVFAKQFDAPIERIYQGTSGTRIVTYVNTMGASNYGVEVEARKSLGAVAGNLHNFDIFANATLMKSKIEIDPNAGSVTNSSRKMVGQAPYVLNAGLSWVHPSGSSSATLLYNRVGERISEAGEQPLPDVVIEERDVLDFSLQFPVAGTLSGKFNAKNLLDAPYMTTQGSVVRESYRVGRSFSIGFSWSH